MEPQLFEMLQDRFGRQDDVLGEIRDTLKEHVKKDEMYWKKIDTLDAQVKALKGVGSAIVFLVGVAEWLFRR